MNCPRCNAGTGNGFFVLERPIKVKFAFIAFSAIFNMVYCPHCGLLKFSFAGINAEGKL